MLVWRDGFPDWKPAKDVVELKGETLLSPPLPTNETRNGGVKRPRQLTGAWQLTPKIMILIR